ncbi:MAG: glycoside hydrolase family 5 protein [Planctomycetota bacterium]
MPLTVHRGTNISHWLSQSARRGEERRAFFTQTDVRRLADWGVDHLRLPVDEEQLWDEAGRPIAEAFDLLDAALDWCRDAGLKAIVDLHILRSHHFNAPDAARLFTDPVAAEHLADLWRQLSARLSGRPNDQVAYELLNEAVAPDDEDWNRVAMIAFQVARDLEPHRTIVLGSNRCNSPTTYDRLRIPDDPETILTFHYYRPMLITHYRAHWWAGGRDYDGPVHYPGRPIAEADLAGARAALGDHLDELNQPYDRDRMAADLAQPLAARRRTGLPLYCGEFGVYHLAPADARLAWYRDFLSVLDNHDIAWANWDYKGNFGLVDADGRPTAIAEVLTA